MIQVTQDHAAPHSAGTSPEPYPHLDALAHDERTLLGELHWFLSWDWQQIIKDPTIAKALIRRSTKAALVSEDIHADLIQRIGHASTANPSGANGNESGSSDREVPYPQSRDAGASARNTSLLPR